jgi:predicted dehydrogenase
MIVYDDMSDEKIMILDKGVDRVPRLGERMDFDQADRFQFLHRTGDILLPRIEGKEPLRVETAHFLDSVRSGASPLTGPRHARDVVAVLAAGQESLAGGGRVVAVAG